MHQWSSSQELVCMKVWVWRTRKREWAFRGRRLDRIPWYVPVGSRSSSQPHGFIPELCRERQKKSVFLNSVRQEPHCLGPREKVWQPAGRKNCYPRVRLDTAAFSLWGLEERHSALAPWGLAAWRASRGLHRGDPYARASVPRSRQWHWDDGTIHCLQRWLK